MSAAQSSPPATKAPAVPIPLSVSTAKSWKDHWLAIASAWVIAIVVAFLYYNQQYRGSLGKSASASLEGLSHAVANGGLDGRYVCSSLDLPSTVTIEGPTATIELGVASVRGMRVERHGDTVSMSGGQAYDAEGKPVDEETQRAISGGNGVELFTVGDDGQSLSLELRDGKKAKFVKQP